MFGGIISLEFCKKVVLFLTNSAKKKHKKLIGQKNLGLGEGKDSEAIFGIYIQI